ncbi:hypothetical protein ACFFVB_06185 [Formosa undariae]|uniref:Heparinase n=1 Tax=Formosa undariae TaxID=1325436 RepID=A0ABV5EZQ2_9FLAO
MSTNNKLKSSVAISIIILFVMSSVLLNCNSKQEPSNLDITEFLKHARTDTIYPSAKQMEMLKVIIPETTYKAAPSISDRTYWDAIATTKSAQEYLKDAEKLLGKQPEVPITDSIYRLANKDGNRKIYKPRYYRTMEHLEHYILAECLENKGRFIPQINTYMQAIMDMKSWLHPNHDDKDNGVLEGRRVSIDLGARKFGMVLALGESLLGDSLSETMRTDIQKQLQWRITDNYLKSCEIADENNRWIDGTSNWNSVCTSGALFVTITNSTSHEERIAAVGSAINSMKHYVSGFGEDGYCSEGLGYWGYGFNHYLYLAQMVSDYTSGKINLFEGENPQKLKNVGNFPEQFEIQNGTCAPFADGVSHISSTGSNFAEVLSAAHYGAIKPSEIRFEEAVEQIIAWDNPEMFTPNTTQNSTSELADHTYFDDFGMVISRGKQDVPFSIAIKAGHNAENHNHSDVGTYILVVDDELISGDIGAPSYMAGSFSPNNKARSSWGHPVPKINNTLQSNGKTFKGIITETNFSEQEDKVVMDIKPAYDLAVLNMLTRTMTNDKTGNGRISIEDHFEASEAVAFGSAIMTFANYEILDGNTVLLIGKRQKLKVEISSSVGQVVIHPEPVPVEHLREGKGAKRIGIDFETPVKSGILTLKYTPVYK